MPSLTIRAETWPIAGSFVISRGAKTEARVVCVEVASEGATGRGEGVPYPRYGETVEAALAALESARDLITQRLRRDQLVSLSLPQAARNALDCALWDFEAKHSGVRVWQRAGLAEPAPVTTCFTISLGEAHEMADAARKAEAFALLKLKLGRDGDATRIQAVRKAVKGKRLVVDANEGWTAATLQELLAVCSGEGIELVEQPLPAANDESLRDILRPVPVCADESAHDAEGLNALQGKYDAVNIKLDKTGGLTGAIAMAHEARRLKLKIMVGCMVATSLSMAPALHLAQFADWIDLDGPLMLRMDRAHGLTYANGVIAPPLPGLWG